MTAKKSARSTGLRARQQVSDEKIRERTGRDWEQWLRWLDRRKAQALDHKGIVALLGPEDVGPWYQQMIAVAYEQERGLRAVHEKPAGFEISRTKTIGADAEQVYRFFADGRRRRRWLGEREWKVRTSTPPQRLRAELDGGTSRIEVRVTPVSAGKSRVAVQQFGLRDGRKAEQSKAFWQEKLAELKSQVERGSGA